MAVGWGVAAIAGNVFNVLEGRAHRQHFHGRQQNHQPFTHCARNSTWVWRLLPAHWRGVAKFTPSSDTPNTHVCRINRAREQITEATRKHEGKKGWVDAQAAWARPHVKLGFIGFYKFHSLLSL